MNSLSLNLQPTNFVSSSQVVSNFVSSSQVVSNFATPIKHYLKN